MNNLLFLPGILRKLAQLSKRLRWDRMPFYLLFSTAALYTLLCALTALPVSGPSIYNTYTLQALAWRQGAFSLGMDYPHLELAVFQGDWYVSFPPFPSVPLFLLSFVFGGNTPDHLLVKLYAGISLLCFYKALKKSGFATAPAVIYALLGSFATSLLSLTLNGAVWFQAQTLALCLSALALWLAVGGHYNPALVCYAFSVGCRPFHALQGMVLLAMYVGDMQKRKLCWKAGIRKILPGLAGGLLFAAALGWYNWIRFGNIFEFGHNYLPEFSWQGGVQFSLAHLANNIRTFVLGSPFNADGELNLFGFSFFLCCPVFALMLGWTVRDLLQKRFGWLQAAMLGCFLLQFFLLLLHRTFGGYQFGARYTVDLLFYPMAYLCCRRGKKALSMPAVLFCIAGLAFAFYGAATVIL